MFPTGLTGFRIWCASMTKDNSLFAKVIDDLCDDHVSQFVIVWNAVYIILPEVSPGYSRRTCHLQYDLMTWMHMPYCWSLVKVIYRSTIGSLTKGPVMWRFSVFSVVSLDRLLNSRVAGDLSRHGHPWNCSLYHQTVKHQFDFTTFLPVFLAVSGDKSFTENKLN